MEEEISWHGTHDVRKMRELERENTRLKKLLADRCLEVDALKDILEKNGKAGHEPSTT